MKLSLASCLTPQILEDLIRLVKVQRQQAEREKANLQLSDYLRSTSIKNEQSVYR